MDYLLGRNARNLTYITDNGTVCAKNQHSRWFANQLNPELPNPSSGSVAGGPNADYVTWDSVISGKYPAMDCAPQFCYIYDIQSWATNEITINWNSALSAPESFLAAPEARVTVDEPVDPKDGTLHTHLGRGDGGFSKSTQTGQGWAGYELFAGSDGSGDGLADLYSRDSQNRLWFYAGKPGGFRTAVQVGRGW